MIEIKFPDGSIKKFEKGISSDKIAESISKRLLQDTVAVLIDDKICDLNTTISNNASIKFFKKDDEKALDILRHSAAHIMAQALSNLYGDIQLAIGPSIENGFYYDFYSSHMVSEEDFPKIEEEMKKIINLKIPFCKKYISKKEALKFYENNKYKKELISNLEDNNISFYEQEDFQDLCRGPHVPHTGFVKAIKIMKVSGAYWRGDQKNDQLQRLYGTAFFNNKELNKYLNFLEEAKRRDHRKIGNALGLFSFHNEAAGMPFFHPKGMAMWNELVEYWRFEHKRANYVETKTPIMLSKELWEKSGHWSYYRENMYVSEIDDFQYAIKPMNCPGGMLLFGETNHSYKELPLRAGEIGLVHRHELSGVLSGLFRVRAFHQDDAHIFMTEDQITDEILGVLKLCQKIYSKFGLDFHLELSTRPEKSIGNDEDWEIATNGLRAALDKYDKEYKINEKDGAFYGPKIDVHIKDAIGRTWQCGTIQLDLFLPERFDLNYIGEDGEKHRPIMIHRVVFGSLERFMGILIEHFAGKFPLWLAPTQIIFLPINDACAPYASQLKELFFEENLRMQIDDRKESLNKKIRDAQVMQIPIIVILGENEKKEQNLSVRTLDGKITNNISSDKFIKIIKNHVLKRELAPIVF